MNTRAATTRFPIACFSVLLLLLAAPPIDASWPAGDYRVQPWHMPTSDGSVSQQLAVYTPSYTAEQASGWWFCGHAAMATAMNYLRGNNLTQHEKITQLEWFHQQLTLRQSGYSSDPHRQASIDVLNTIIRVEKADEFASRKITGYDTAGRAYVRDAILETLHLYSSYAVVLSETVVGGTEYGHFYAVYRVNHQPGTPTGGTAYYWDPRTGSLGSMGFAQLLNGMRDAGTANRYSFLRLYRY